MTYRFGGTEVPNYYPHGGIYREVTRTGPRTGGFSLMESPNGDLRITVTCDLMNR
jgi:hypothetical protein